VVLLGTYGRTLEELDRIILGTTTKISPQHFPQSQKNKKKKKKKRGHVECMLSLLIGNMKIKVPKIVCQHFLPQLMG
jgi:hypothetical protein